MITLSFCVPCFNSAEYMEKCLASLVALDEGFGDIEVIVVNDGSSDDTQVIAERWENQYPGIVKAVSKQNGGHGSAVNTGLALAEGCYYKVVDSDDWIDEDAMKPVLKFLREQKDKKAPCDLVISNYVYEKVYEDAQVVMNYTNVFPQDDIFTWGDIKRFHPSQYLLMHSVIYRTAMLHEVGLQLPEHTFYVDNIFVYVPLPAVKSIRYFNQDVYRYFIGREGQSVNQETMMKRMDQQLRVTRIMIDSVDLNSVFPKKLRHYMESYLSMMMCICSVFLRMKNTPEDELKLKEIWAYLKDNRPDIYSTIRLNVLNLSTNIPSELGRRIGLGGYHIAQKIFKFN